MFFKCSGSCKIKNKIKVNLEKLCAHAKNIILCKLIMKKKKRKHAAYRELARVLYSSSREKKKKL